MTAKVFGKISEKAFLQKIVQLAVCHRWWWAHFTQAQVRDGAWVTPQRGHLGFPDLVLARNGQLIIAEVKAEDGKPSAEQLAWLERLGPTGRLWYPADWEQIVQDLR